jgi:hypothetical protein
MRNEMSLTPGATPMRGLSSFIARASAELGACAPTGASSFEIPPGPPAAESDRAPPEGAALASGAPLLRFTGIYPT